MGVPTPAVRISRAAFSGVVRVAPRRLDIDTRSARVEEHWPRSDSA
jgi:hypothetical protein